MSAPGEDQIAPHSPPVGDLFPLEGLVTQNEEVYEAFRDQAAVADAGELIQEMRESAKLTQQQLATELKVSLHYLREMEAGANMEGPSFCFMKKVARLCQTQLTAKVEGEKHDSLRASVVARLRELGNETVSKFPLFTELDEIPRRLASRVSKLEASHIKSIC